MQKGFKGAKGASKVKSLFELCKECGPDGTMGSLKDTWEDLSVNNLIPRGSESHVTSPPLGPK